jgi:ankyrin repeat protein
MAATSSPVESDSMASYSDLPAELILQVGGLLEKKRHLATLAELNRFSRDLITPRLYALHASEAVRWSADQGDLDILQAALRHTNKTDVASLVNQKCNWNYRRDISPLAIACFMGHKAIVSCLLDHGARIDEPFRCDVHCSVHFETSVPLACPTTQWLPLQAAIFK